MLVTQAGGGEKGCTEVPSQRWGVGEGREAEEGSKTSGLLQRARHPTSHPNTEQLPGVAEWSHCADGDMRAQGGQLV